jgi:hypothetical protein
VRRILMQASPGTVNALTIDDHQKVELPACWLNG